jgi:integrase
MAKTLSEAAITTASARGKLASGEFARRLDADASVWYRKGVRGGVWFARWRNHGPGANYKQAPIGPANDVNDKPAAGLFTYQQAEQEARKIVARARAELKAAAAGPILTVQMAIEEYVQGRDARDSRRKGRTVRSDASRRLARYVLGQMKRGKQASVPPAPIASVALHALAESDIQAWLDALPEAMKPSSRQRLINDFKAALNTSYAGNRERLEATFPAIVKHGLRAADRDDSTEPVARDNQILGDGDVARLIRASREIDVEDGWEGDLFRLVIVLAATGARFSQAARIRVSGCQISAGRLMMPVSRKGRGGKSGETPVPIGRDVLDELVSVANGRKGDSMLLERWRHRQVSGTQWERVGRGPWQASSELGAPWRIIRERAGLPEVIPYALRHSSIVRGIRQNLPIRLVAALHDTSVAMIERHYAKWITSGLEDMARAAIVPLVSPEAGGRVIQFTGG